MRTGYLAKEGKSVYSEHRGSFLTPGSSNMTNKITPTILIGLCVAALTAFSGCSGGTAIFFTHSRWLIATDGIVVVFPKIDPEQQNDSTFAGVTPDAVFLTDIHGNAAALARESNTKLIVVSEAEKKNLADPQGEFWNQYLVKERFNEESCAPTNRPFAPCPPSVEIRGVKEGDVIEIEDISFHVLETPGMGKNSISYYIDTNNNTLVSNNIEGFSNSEDKVVEVEDFRVAFVGDLIHSDGKIANLYDLQDNFPVAQIGPYHGFMARAPQLIASLEKVRAVKPTFLMSARTTRIENPDEAIDALIARLRAVYRNYLSTSALWWYFGEERMNASAVAILGNVFDPTQFDRMPEAKKYDNPDWLIDFSTTRMIRSETGEVFVMDVNSDREAERMINMHKNGEFKKVTGMFVTHYHHDHNTGVPKVADYFSAPVYGTPLTADILERPGAYRMPCIQNIVVPVVRKNDGETMKWNEFEFTFFDFPGQTLNHSALLVQKRDERPIFFIGDSFTPTGIDDYCAWNRNLLKDGKGYLYCIEKIRSLDPLPLLVNAHVTSPFELDTKRLDYIERALRERMVLLADLLAVPEINFGLDHAWCRFDPFVAECTPEQSIVLRMVITNHFDEQSEFRIVLEPDDEFPFQFTPSELVRDLDIEPGKEQLIEWTLQPTGKKTKIGFLSARVTSKDSLTGRCEAVMKMVGE